MTLQEILETEVVDTDVTIDYAVDLTGASPEQIHALIEKYHEDDDALGCAAMDIINSLIPWLTTNANLISLGSSRSPETIKA